MNYLVLYSATNAKGKKDATGAFIPEAKAFAKLHGIPDSRFIGMKLVGVPRGLRKRRTLQLIHDAGSEEPLDGIFFFGHGWPNGIQFGFHRQDIPELCSLLVRKCQPNVTICLYACLAAENDVRDRDVLGVGPGTDGGFADLLRDGMVRVGITDGKVDAHKTFGHTSWNPYLVRFLCRDVDDPEFGAEGGAWLVAPRSELWKEWVDALRDQKGGLRYRFPFMREVEIKLELAGYPFDTQNPYN